MPDASAAARMASSLHGQMSMPMRALCPNMPVFKKHDSGKPIGVLAPGETVLVLETKMDKRGRAWVHHAKGWTPMQTDDGRPGLAPVQGRTAPPKQQQRTQPPVVAPAVGDRLAVRVSAPYFAKHEKDKAVLGVLQPGGDAVVEVLEVRQDSAGKWKVRHRQGWTPLLAPNGSLVLERVSGPPSSGGGAAGPAPAKVPWPDAEGGGEAASAEPAAAAAAAAAAGPPRQQPQPQPRHPVGRGARGLQRRHSVTTLDGPVRAGGARAHAPGIRGQAGAAGPAAAAAGGAASHLPAGGVSAGLRRAATRARSGSAESRGGPGGGERAGQWYKVRLLYISREQGFGLKFGQNTARQPTIEGFWGDKAKHAGVIQGSIVIAVAGVAVHTVQDLGIVLSKREQSQDCAVDFTLATPAMIMPAAAAAPQPQTAGDQLMQMFAAGSGTAAAQPQAQPRLGRRASHANLNRRPSMAAIGESRLEFDDTSQISDSLEGGESSPRSECHGRFSSARRALGVGRWAGRGTAMGELMGGALGAGWMHAGIELTKLAEQTGAVSDEAVQLMAELPRLRSELADAEALPFGSKSPTDIDDLKENIA
jgi:hypothetical protein